MDYSYGKDEGCQCDIGVSTMQDALAHEFEIIYASYESEIEARACSPSDNGSPDFSYITQTCWAESAADLSVRVRLYAATHQFCRVVACMTALAG